MKKLQTVHYDKYIPYTGNYALCCVDDFSQDMVFKIMTKLWKQVTCKKCLKLKFKETHNDQY